MTQRTEKGFAVVGPDGAIAEHRLPYQTSVFGHKASAKETAERLNKHYKPGHRAVECTITWEEPEDEG